MTPFTIIFLGRVTFPKTSPLETKGCPPFEKRDDQSKEMAGCTPNTSINHEISAEIKKLIKNRVYPKLCIFSKTKQNLSDFHKK